MIYKFSLFLIIQKLAAIFIYYKQEEEIQIPLSKSIIDGLQEVKTFSNSSFKNEKKKYLLKIRNTKDNFYKFLCYNELAALAMKHQMYDEALQYINKSFKFSYKKNINLLKWRIVCYKKLKEYMSLLKDLTLYDTIINSEENKDLIAELRNSITKNICMNVNPFMLNHSNLRFYLFFCSVFPIIHDNDFVSKAIIKEDFSFLNDMLKCNGLDCEYVKKYQYDYFSYRFVKSSLFFLKEFYVEALNCLGDFTNPLEYFFFEYLIFLVYKLPPTNGFFEIFYNSKYISNPTIKFYFAKLLLCAGNETEYLRLMNELSDYQFSYYELISYYRSKNDFEMGFSTAKKAFALFNDDPMSQIYYLEYIILQGNNELFSSSIKKMKNDCLNDLFMAYFLRETNTSEAISRLEIFIKKNETYIPAYIELSGLYFKLQMYDECRKTLTNALYKSSCLSEVYELNLMLLDLEVYKNVQNHKNLYNFSS